MHVNDYEYFLGFGNIYTLLHLILIRIIVGAPLGRYPGGLNLPLNSSICELYDEARNINRDISALTDTEIRECYLHTGLIYSCPLVGSTTCGPVLGDMDAYGADGALYDRVGEFNTLVSMLE